MLAVNPRHPHTLNAVSAQGFGADADDNLIVYRFGANLRRSWTSLLRLACIRNALHYKCCLAWLAHQQRNEWSGHLRQNYYFLQQSLSWAFQRQHLRKVRDYASKAPWMVSASPVTVSPHVHGMVRVVVRGSMRTWARRKVEVGKGAVLRLRWWWLNSGYKDGNDNVMSDSNALHMKWESQNHEHKRWRSY